VAERDRTAVHVHALGVESQLPDDGQGLRRERLVQLDQVEIGDLEAGAGEELSHRGDGPDPHHARIDAADGARYEAPERLGAEPLGRFVASAVGGVDPRVMGIGPVPAVRKLLARAGLEVADLDLVELNEAFASQSLTVIRELGLDPQRVNVNGGAIALGHPLGMSGARLVVTLLHELRRRGARLGLATLCVGVGQGQAALFTRGDRP